MSENMYVDTMLRSMREKCPWPGEPRTIILVSNLFYNEARRYMKERNETLSPRLKEEPEVQEGGLLFRNTPMFPVDWLSDWQFEIRTQTKTTVLSGE